jgi:hypothetical protein
MRKFGVAIFPDERAASGELGALHYPRRLRCCLQAREWKHSSARSLRQGTSLDRNCGEVGWLDCPRGPCGRMGATGGALIRLSAELTNRGALQNGRRPSLRRYYEITPKHDSRR